MTGILDSMGVLIFPTAFGILLIHAHCINQICTAEDVPEYAILGFAATTPFILYLFTTLDVTAAFTAVLLAPIRVFLVAVFQLTVAQYVVVVAVVLCAASGWSILIDELPEGSR